MKTIKLKTLLVLMGSSWFLFACTKKVEKINHEEAKTSAVKMQDDKESKETDGGAKKILTQQELVTLDPKVRKATTTEEFKSLSQELKSTVLSEDILRNPEARVSDSFRKSLSYLNYSIIKWSEKSNSDAELDALLVEYQKNILAGCTLQLTQCQNIKIFAQDPLSNRVLLLVIRKLQAKIEKSSKELLPNYYQLIRVAYELKNKQQDEDLDFQYILFARSYAEYLNSLKTYEGQEELRQHGRTFQLLIQTYSGAKNSENFKKFLADFKPWTYSRQENGIFSYGTKELFASAAQVLLYEPGTKKLSADFKKTVLEMQNSPEKNKTSFKKILESMQANHKMLMEGFGVETRPGLIDDFYDEYFYIIDRLFGGHISSDEAMQIWNQTDKDPKRIYEKFEYYLKINIMNVHLYTISESKKNYMNNATDSDSMLKVTLEGGQYISMRWSQAIAAANIVANFIVEQLSRENKTDSIIDIIKLTQTSIDRNVRHIAGDPSMLLLSYFMSEKNAALVFNTWWGGELKIDATVIINSLLGGELSSWFRFGMGNNEIISKYELNFAYHYALISGLFDSFEDANGKPILKSDGTAVLSHYTFFKTMIQKYLSAEKQALDRANEALDQYSTSDPQFQLAMDYCAASKNNTTSFILAVDQLMDLKDYAFTGTGKLISGNSSLGVSSVLGKLYTDGYTGVAVTTPMIQMEIIPKLNQIRIMVDILEADSLYIKGNPESKKELISSVRKLVDDMQGNVNKYIGNALKLHQKIADCHKEAIRKEIQVRNEFIKYEIARLERIYDKAIPFLQGNASAESWASFAQQSDLGLRTEMEEVSAQGYTYNELNFLLRLANWVSQLKPIAASVVLPTDKFKNLPSYDKKYVISFKDEAGKVVSKSEFVKSALQRINGNQNSFLNWFNDSVGVIQRLNKISGLSSLMKMRMDLKITDAPLIKASDVVAELNELIRLMQMDADDLVLYPMLSLDRKITKDDLARVLAIEDDDRATPYENTYEKMIKSFKDRALTDFFFIEGKVYYDFKSRSLHYLFKPSSKISEITHSYLAPHFLELDKIIQETDAAIKASETGTEYPWGAGPFIYRISMGNKISWTPRKDAEGSILLSREKKMDMKNSTERFHRETRNCFRTQCNETQK